MISILSTAWTLFFPFSLLLIVYPVDFFIRNQVELQSDIALLNSILISAAVVGGICLFGAFLSSVTNKRLQWLLASAGLYLGLYFIVSDLVAPVSFDKHIGFDGSESILPPDGIRIAADIVLFLVFGFLLLRFRNPALIKMGAMFTLIFVVVNVGQNIGQFAPREAGKNAVEKWNVKTPAPETPADRPNVYHLVLDGFQGGYLPEALSLVGLKKSDFDGFTYFPKNRSNYDGTQMSFPSFMTGTIYRSGSLKTWYNAWYSSGMWSKIRESYDANILVYSVTPTYLAAPINATRKSSNDSVNTIPIDHVPAITFHIALARVVPSYLHEFIYRNGQGLFSSIKDNSPHQQKIDPRLQPFRDLIDDENGRPSRGQYVYLHIYVPHSPFLLDENCKAPLPDQIFHFNQQAGCAIKYVNEFLETLRALGRYEESIILVHSDHGWGAGDPIEPLKGSPEEARVQAMDLTEQNPRSVKSLDTWTAALLMIKPPGQSGAPMVTSPRSTQLVDLPNTIYDLLSLDIKAPEGMSVLSEDYPEVAERHVYPGFRRWDRKAGKQVWVGKEVLEGDLNHFSWTSGKGWKVYPNMPFSWE